MGLRQVLAKNFKAMMVAKGFSSLKEVTAANGGSNGTLDRIRREASGTSVDSLEQLAGALGLEPWQLLHPDLDPKAPPKVSSFSLAAEALALAYDELPDGREKQDMLARLLGQLQLRSPAPPPPKQDGSAPSAEAKPSRAPAPKKRAGKSPARS